MNSFIVTDNLGKMFKDADRKVCALREVFLSIKKGSYVSIAGPSGAGKSTLLHLLGGLDYPTSGSIVIDGQDISKFKARERFCFRNKKIGFVFQFYYLIEELTVLENVMLPALAGKNSRRTSSQKAGIILSLLGLSERLNFYPSQLSGGEQQRVAIARALINEPEILLCDEPTGNLDKDSAKNITILLRKMNEEKGITIILVTHNLELAKEAQNVLNIRDGQILNSNE